MSSVRERVHGRSSARGRREEIRRIGSQHDRPAPLRERRSLVPAARTGTEPGHPAAGGHAMRRLPSAASSMPGTDRIGEIVAETAVLLQPALDELKRQAAQGEVVHNDDTSMRVLSLDRDADISPERTGVFTSGLVWIYQERRIALFFTGCKHAGENLAEVLKQRSPDLPPAIQ